MPLFNIPRIPGLTDRATATAKKAGGRVRRSIEPVVNAGRGPVDPQPPLEWGLPGDRLDPDTNGRALINVLDNSLADWLAPAALQLRGDCSSLGANEWVRSWYVRDWPEYLSTRPWQNILRFPGDVRVSAFMEPLPAVIVGRQLESQATAMMSEKWLRAMQRRDQSMVVDREMQEIQRAQWSVQIDGEPFYQFTMVLSLYGTSRSDLDEWSAKLEDIFREAGIVIDRALDQQIKGLRALQPLNLNDLGNHTRNMPLEPLVSFFPFTGRETVEKDGLWFGQSLVNNMGVTLNPFALDNPNIVIIGPPGGGKSYWIKDFVTQCVTRGFRAYVLDIEREYELLCEDLGGVYLDMGLKSLHKINVLDPDPQDDLAPEDRSGLAGAYQDFKEWLATAIQRPLEAGEIPVLDRSYAAVMNDKGIFFDDIASLHKPAPLLSDLMTRLTQDPSPYALRLADELYPMAAGSEQEAFNCATNVDVRSSPLVVFGLKNVPRPMMARRIRQIQQLTWNQMLTNEHMRKTIEVVDEAWFLLQHPHTALDLAERARRFRKKNGLLVVATQHADDFSRSAAAEAVLEIASTHLLFRQKRHAVGRLADLFGLDDGESATLATMRKGQYLMLADELHIALRKDVPPARDELYTTKPDEVMAYRQRRRVRREAYLAARQAEDAAFGDEGPNDGVNGGDGGDGGQDGETTDDDQGVGVSRAGAVVGRATMPGARSFGGRQRPAAT